MYVTRYAINSWGVLYLQEARGYSLIEAGGLVGLNTFTGIIGCVAYGFISDKYFNARRPPVTLLFGIAEIASLFFNVLRTTVNTCFNHRFYYLWVHTKRIARGTWWIICKNLYPTTVMRINDIPGPMNPRCQEK